MNWGKRSTHPGMPVYLCSIDEKGNDTGYRISIARHGENRSYLAAWQDKEIVGAAWAPANDDQKKREAIASLQGLCEQHQLSRIGAPSA